MAAAEKLCQVCVLQAYVRGYLVRKKFRILRQDYESIVKEIEGSMVMLEWDGKELPRPKFRNQGVDVADDVNIYYPSLIDPELSWQLRINRTAGLEVTVYGRQLSGTEGVYNVPKSKTSEALCPEAEKSADCSLFENDEPVKDSCESRNSSSRQSIPKQLEVPNTLNTDTSSHGQAPQIEGVTPFLETEEASCARGDERRDHDNSTSVMSACISTVLENISNASIASEMQDTPNEPLCKLQRKEMPTTCQELQNYRSSLAMELLWLQQAIASRKNYLILKQQLGPPER